MKLFVPLAVAYVALVVLANWLASNYLITVPFTHYIAPAGVLCVGAVLVMRDSTRLWNALGSLLYPRWLYRGPCWWRSLNAWWLGWWGAAFFHTDPWGPFRAPR